MPIEFRTPKLSVSESITGEPLLKVLRFFFQNTKLQKRSRDLQINKQGFGSSTQIVLNLRQ